MCEPSDEGFPVFHERNGEDLGKGDGLKESGVSRDVLLFVALVFCSFLVVDSGGSFQCCQEMWVGILSGSLEAGGRVRAREDPCRVP